MNQLETEAAEVGRSRGYDHANYVTAYGGDLRAEPDVPSRYAPVATYFTAAYEEGVQAYLNED